MGTTTKIWPASTVELRRYLAEPAYVGAMFHRCGDDHALIHDSLHLERLLRALAEQGPGVQAITGARDPSFVMSADCVAAMLDEAPGDPYRAILGFPTMCVNRVEIADLARRAAAAGSGLVFCVFEDW